MIPILFSKTETSFYSNGLGRLAESTSCTVTEERNGIYELLMTYPISGKLFDQLEIGSFVYAIHDDAKSPQAFEIYKIKAGIDGIATIYAQHISYKLTHITAKPFTASSCAQAITKLGTQTLGTNPFTFATDKSVQAAFSLTVPTAVRAALGGQAGSILDTYGKADLEWDMYTVHLWQNRGMDRGVEIRYGKNLSDLTQEKDATGTYNAAAPYWAGSDGTVITLPEWYLTANEYEPSDELSIVPLDLSAEFDEPPSVSALRMLAQSKLDSGSAWLPKENITVSFVQLWQTAEYANVAPLQRCRLCDTVTVIYPALKIRAKLKVIKTEYDVLLERYTSMELGEPRTTLGELIHNKIMEDVRKEVPSKSFLEAAINQATEMITGGLGGYVVINKDSDGHPTELLIMDTPDINTAVNVWRWNLGGLGHSSTGYNGQFSTAITADGHIVANFIDVGTLTANIIKAGIIQAQDSPNYWNMETGEVFIGAYADGLTDVRNDLGDQITNVQGTMNTLQSDINGVRQSLSGYATIDGDLSEVYARISSTAEGLTLDYTALIDTVDDKADANAKAITERNKRIKIDSSGITISAKDTGIHSLFTESELSFQNTGGTKLAWIGAEGLGTPELSIGDATSSVSQWRIVSNGTHLTFTRRSG